MSFDQELAAIERTAQDIEEWLKQRQEVVDEEQKTNRDELTCPRCEQPLERVGDFLLCPGLGSCGFREL
jgi:uncharacterized protein with PIN domain